MPAVLHHHCCEHAGPNPANRDELIARGEESTMRKVILQEFVSIDSLAAGPGDSWPVVLGSGTPLFGDEAPALELRLQETKAFDHGEVALKYTP
jgi:hypothetical protein